VHVRNWRAELSTELLGFRLAGTLPPQHCKGRRFLLLAWRNWQTRTAQDRMGQPVEVRVLSRAVTFVVQSTLSSTRTRAVLVGTAVAYFEPAFLLAAQRAFISSDSLFRPAGVSAPLLRVATFCFPPAFLLAAQRAFINWESFLRPAGVS
jgi:hypothetical protein